LHLYQDVHAESVLVYEMVLIFFIVSVSKFTVAILVQMGYVMQA